jgi:hypothetical protein
MTSIWCGIIYDESPNGFEDLTEILVLARFSRSPSAMPGQCRQYQL